jgi:hypothetical protein
MFLRYLQGKLPEPSVLAINSWFYAQDKCNLNRYDRQCIVSACHFPFHKAWRLSLLRVSHSDDPANRAIRHCDERAIGLKFLLPDAYLRTLGPLSLV